MEMVAKKKGTTTRAKPAATPTGRPNQKASCRETRATEGSLLCAQLAQDPEAVPVLPGVPQLLQGPGW